MIHIVYHQIKLGTDCPDGIMSAAIAALCFQDYRLDFNIIGDNYRNINDYGDIPDNLPEFLIGDLLYILDFSYPKHWLEYWENLGVTIKVLDHHEPKFPMLQGFSGAILDASECGATLTWKYFFSEQPVPEVLLHVKRRDIGSDGYYKSDENCRKSKKINAAMSQLRHVSDNPLELCQSWLLDDSCIERLEDLGDSLLKEEEKLVKEISKKVFDSELLGYFCGKIVLEPHEMRLVSQIGNYLARNNPQYDFIWLISVDGIENSLRSFGGFDVSEVARSLGGDGHKAASGFILKK